MNEITFKAPNGKSLRIQVADSFFARLRGLMLRSRESLPLGKGLLIAPCSSIHMMFMRFSIDVVYLDREYRILKLVKALPAWVGLSYCHRAWATLELPAGSIESYRIHVGDKLGLKK